MVTKEPYRHRQQSEGFPFPPKQAANSVNRSSSILSLRRLRFKPYGLSFREKRGFSAHFRPGGAVLPPLVFSFPRGKRSIRFPAMRAGRCCPELPPYGRPLIRGLMMESCRPSCLRFAAASRLRSRLISGFLMQKSRSKRCFDRFLDTEKGTSMKSPYFLVELGRIELPTS